MYEGKWGKDASLSRHGGPFKWSPCQPGLLDLHGPAYGSILPSSHAHGFWTSLLAPEVAARPCKRATGTVPPNDGGSRRTLTARLGGRSAGATITAECLKLTCECSLTCGLQFTLNKHDLGTLWTVLHSSSAG